MIKGLIGKKLGMTQIFTEEGDWIPVTIIEAGPCTILQKKTDEKDGYSALKLGFGQKDASKAKKPEWGAYAKACLPKNKDKQPTVKRGKKAPLVPLRLVREIRADSAENIEEYSEGQEVKLDIFRIGEFVDITGNSKGKGFAGVVKRYGFKGGEDTHGSMFHRAPGSVGASAYPARVFKGKKMPGHLGNKRVTAIKLQIMDIRPNENIILVRGSVPGPNNGYLIIRKSKREQRL
jgi:large subunit ribosomal protein L3